MSPAEVSAQSSSAVKTSHVDLGGSEFWTGYWDGDVSHGLHNMGVQDVTVKYGAAICIPPGSPMAENRTIEGMRLLFPDGTVIAGYSVFMSTTLPSEAKYADIYHKDLFRGCSPNDLKNRLDPFNEIRFDKPYRYDPAKPLYIGYTLSLSDRYSENEIGALFPIVVYTGEERENALLLNFNGGEWKDYNGCGFGILAMQVLMSGTFPANDVKIAPRLETVSTTRGSVMLPVVVTNCGSSGISSLKVSVDVNGVVTSHEVCPDETVMGIGTPYRFGIEVDTPASSGMYKYKVSVSEVNGVHLDKDVSGTGDFIVLSRLVPHRVLVEEFTGMDYQYAPEGIVGLQKLHQRFGSNVVLVSAHHADSISCAEYNEIIESSVFDFPQAHLDRSLFAVNPHDGSSGRGIISDAEACMAVPPVAEIKVVPRLDGNILTAETETKFLFSGDASNYALAYIITEDCMKDDEWLQANYFSGMDSGNPGFPYFDPMFEPWIDAPEFVPGVEYNHVAITARGIKNGIPGSIPHKVREEVSVYHEEEFDLTNWSKIKHRDRLNVIAVLFDTSTGRVVNSCLTPLNKAINGIEEVTTNTGGIQGAVYYDTDGMRLTAPQKGVNIVKYPDGKIKKVTIR